MEERCVGEEREMEGVCVGCGEVKEGCVAGGRDGGGLYR